MREIKSSDVKKTLDTAVAKVNSNVILRNIILAVCAIVVFVFIISMLLNLFTRHSQSKEVPDFGGMDVEQAMQVAREGSVKLEINDSLYVPEFQGGIILDQIPKPGSPVKSGRKIFVTVNSFNQKMVRIPYVTGFSLRQAKNNLMMAGLEIDRIIYREDMATNSVLEESYRGTSISSGSRKEAPKGSGITLVVGWNPGEQLPVMPKFIGLSPSEAKNRLWDLGLNVGKLTFDDDIKFVNRNDSRVYSQSPAPSVAVDPGTNVDLRFTTDEDKTSKGAVEAEKAAKAIQEALKQAQAEAEAESSNENE